MLDFYLSKILNNLGLLFILYFE